LARRETVLARRPDIVWTNDPAATCSFTHPGIVASALLTRSNLEVMTKMATRQAIAYR